MMSTSHAVYAFLLAAIATIGIIVLAAVEVPIPDVLSAIAGGGAVGGAALALPTAYPRPQPPPTVGIPPQP